MLGRGCLLTDGGLRPLCFVVWQGTYSPPLYLFHPSFTPPIATVAEATLNGLSHSTRKIPGLFDENRSDAREDFFRQLPLPSSDESF